MKIPITKTVLGEEEQRAIIEPLKTGWLVQGPNVAKFEKMFVSYTDCSFAKATTSCTTALQLALNALSIGPGDKVVVPSFTYIASANAVVHSGADVVFCDIDLETFNIDVNQLKQLVEQDKAIKAIMPVDLFGLCANMPAVMDIAKKHGLSVIEDAACAFDAWVGNKHAGTFGEFGCFSFHPRKAITTGEGGMLVTHDAKLANKMGQLADHGASKSDFARHKDKGGSLLPEFYLAGFNFRMTDIQGAMGVCQMEKAEAIMAGRRKIAKQYDEALKDVSALVSPMTPEGYKHAYQSYVCLFALGKSVASLNKTLIDELNQLRNSFMDKLEENGIATRQGTHAVHTLAYYKERYSLSDEDFLMAYAADRLSVSLPLYAGMTDEEFNYVIENIKEALR